MAARGTDIPALTGLRWFAAIVVVGFHIRGNIREEYRPVADALWPILDNGYLGVDLFFALSGFVLTLNYGDRLGAQLRKATTATFLWARIARVWPAYFVTLLIAAAWHGGLMIANEGDPVPVDEYSVLSFLRQASLVVLWTSSDYDRLAWNGPSWSVSAEALAYVAFPVIALVLFRLRRNCTARRLALIGMACVLPVIAITGIASSVYSPYSWVLRLFGAFLAGSLICLAVARLRESGRSTERLGQILTYGCLIAIPTTLYVTYALQRPNASILAVFFFPPLLAGLALSRRGVAGLLGTRALVLGGKISYSLYLTHMIIVIEPFWWAQGKWPNVFGGGELGSKIYFPLVPLLSCLTGYVLWRLVEEPARRHLLAMRPFPKVRQPPATDPVATAVDEPDPDPIIDQPIIDQPIDDQPIIDQPIGDQPIGDAADRRRSDLEGRIPALIARGGKGGWEANRPYQAAKDGLS